MISWLWLIPVFGVGVFMAWFIFALLKNAADLEEDDYEH